jgi:uncharacterized membrane protein
MEAAMLLANCATLATALFTGAAVYVTFVEQPARMKCSTEIALSQWRPSYKRARIMQATLAILGFLLAIAAWLYGAGLVWLIAGLFLVAVVPFTLLVMWPTNKLLEETDADMPSELTRDLLSHWANLHAVRTALSVIALLLMIFVAR